MFLLHFNGMRAPILGLIVISLVVSTWGVYVLQRGVVESPQSMSERVVDFVVNQGITTLEKNCVSVMEDERTEEARFFVIRERHNAQCGGDPSTSPRIATIRVDLQTGEMQHDLLQ